MTTLPRVLLAVLLLAAVCCPLRAADDTSMPPGVPGVPQNQTLTYNDGILCISWTQTVTCANFSYEITCERCFDLWAPGSPSTTKCRRTGSVIQVQGFSHTHDALDYAVAPPSSTCTSCTTASAGLSQLTDLNDLPQLQLKRIHRYRDLISDSSFGPGVFSSYDAKLYLGTGSSIGSPYDPQAIEYLDPEYLNPITLYDGSWANPWGYADITDGIYHDLLTDMATDLRLYDAAGQVTNIQSQAATAVLTLKRGEVRRFQIVSINGLLVGRLLSITDRNGYATTIAYRYQPGNTPLASSELWQIQTITDAYGNQAAFTYHPQQQSGRWAVSRIDLPGSQQVQYGYTNGLLSQVTLANGDVAHITVSYLPEPNLVAVDYDDPGSDGTHRRKRAIMTTQFSILPDTGCIAPTSGQLLRMIANGNQEVTYLSIPHPNYSIPLMYEGSGKLMRDGYWIGGASALDHRREYAKSWTFSPTTPISYNSFGLTTMEPKSAWDSYAPANNYRDWFSVRPVTERLESGLVIKLTYDAAGNRTSATFPDGTVARATYNQFQQPTLRVDRLNRAEDMVYDAQGNLTSRRSGLRYDPATQMVTTTADTATWTYEYTGDSSPTPFRLSAKVDPVGNRTDYAYDSRGYLASITSPPDVAFGPRAVTAFLYNAQGLTTQMTVSGAQSPIATRFGYDGRNRLTETRYADDSTDARKYGIDVDTNLVASETDRNGNLRRYGYDATGRKILLDVFPAGSGVAISSTSWTYLDGTDKPATMTVDGDRTTYVYDYLHRLVQTVRTPAIGVNLATTTTFGTNNLPAVVVDAYGRRTWYGYDGNDHRNRVVRELVIGGVSSAPADLAAIPAFVAGLTRIGGANPAYVIEDATYDAADQILTRTDGRGTRQVSSYTMRGQLASRTEAQGGSASEQATTLYRYDAAGNLIEMTDPRGFITAMTYTGRNFLATRTEAVGTSVAATTSTAYTPTGKVWMSTDALGRVTSFQYGGCCDRLAGITDPLGHQTLFAYDLKGNRISVTDANGVVTLTTYDGLDRVLTTKIGATSQQPLTTRLTYDEHLGDGAGLDSAIQAVLSSLNLVPGAGDGSAVAVTNPQLETSYELRDALGRVVARIDPLGHASRIVYDHISTSTGLVQVTAIDALGHAVSSQADSEGQSRRVVDALGKIATAGFDAAGNQVNARDADQIGWNAGYDLRNRITSRSDTRITGAGSTFWTYDRNSNRLSETDAALKTESNEYDPRNRRILIIDRLLGKTRFSYDLASNLTQISDADNEGRGGLAHADGMTQYAYDVRDLLVAEAFPVGQEGRALRTYEYDGGRRLRVRQVGILGGAFSAAPAFSGSSERTDFGYDAVNRLANRSYPGGQADVFGYDPASQLTSAVSNRYRTTVGREYDAAGRLTRESLTLPDGAIVAGVLTAATYAVDIGYDDANRVTSQTYPTGAVVQRTWTHRNELATVGLDNAPVVTRGYADDGRLLTSAFGNGLIETRSYVAGSPLVAEMRTAPAVGAEVLAFTYTYDAAQRKLTEALALGDPVVTQTQAVGYDDAGRLQTWNRSGVGPPSSQSWNLNKVGDWNSTTRDGVAETRVHTNVHEVTQVGTNLLTYDTKGNLTRDERQTALTWDPENRLVRAVVTRDASETGFGSVASYRFDALGRRIAKTVDGRTTLYLPAGAQTVVEIDRPALPPTQAAIDGAEADGTLENMALPPASGGALAGSGITRINFQPATAATPAGFLRDTGKPSAVRTNGLTYGWSTDASPQAVIRNGAVPLPEFDTFIQAQPDAGGSASWSIALPDGIYPVVVVAGDALSTEQTNNLLIGSVAVPDLTPSMAPAYEAGNFDGYAVDAAVTGGVLTIVPGVGAFHAKLCFVEIGQLGGSVTDVAPDGSTAVARLAALIDKANAETGANPPAAESVRTFVYLDYIDSIGLYQRTANGLTERFYPLANHLYSVAALTDETTGAVVERFTYDAYGKQKITDASGNVTRPKSAVGFDRGFTGYTLDTELSVYFARTRVYFPELGRFGNRMPWFRAGRLVGSNYSIGLLPTELRQAMRTTLRTSRGNYLGSRYNLYDFMGNSPANHTEAFSNSIFGNGESAWEKAARRARELAEQAQKLEEQAEEKAKRLIDPKNEHFKSGDEKPDPKEEAAKKVREEAARRAIEAAKEAPPTAPAETPVDPASPPPKDEGLKKGDRTRDGQAREKEEGIESAQEDAKKDRPSISDEDDEWEGSKKRPKQNRIESTDKTRKRADHERSRGCDEEDE